jgi:altronate hydrolase
MLGMPVVTPREDLTIRLRASDNVVVARVDLIPGTAVEAEGVRVGARIPAGHKLATAAIATGEPVRKYDQIIGFASADIAPGEHVHTHNMQVRNFERDYRIGEAVRRVDFVPEAERATFDGIMRLGVAA